MPELWKNCSTCKTPIPTGGRWYRCSVSTCNSARLQLAFCSMACWDAHIPTMNHRSNVWAVEERAPATIDRPGGVVSPTRASVATAPADRTTVTVSARTSVATTDGRGPVRETMARENGESARRIVRPNDLPAEPQEVLIVASRLKDFVRERSEFNTSADVFDVLSDIVREATLDAIENARIEGRKTVMARDFHGRD